MQITVFWCTVGQKINSYESVKYHKFAFQAALHVPSMGVTLKNGKTDILARNYGGTEGTGNGTSGQKQDGWQR